MVHQSLLKRATRGHRDMIDLTEAVAAAVRESGVATGVAHLSIVGSTGAIGTIEFEPGLCEDLPRLLDRLIPPRPDYSHEKTWHDGNGYSHLQATLLGPSLSVPISEGRLVLGQWQQVFLIECDIQSHERTIVVTVMGEAAGSS